MVFLYPVMNAAVLDKGGRELKSIFGDNNRVTKILD